MIVTLAGRQRLLLLAVFCVAGVMAAWPELSSARDADAALATADFNDEARGPLLWTEIYFESESLQPQSYNPVSDLTLRAGIHALRMNDSDLDLYLKGRIFIDKDRLYWNNRYEFGVGSRWRPFSGEGLIVFAEILSGGYTGIENPEEPNPDASTYQDIQGGVAYWNWWGRQPWQIGQAFEVYWPFTGWREFYGDGIYYHHAGDNLIITSDFKEGLVLGKIGTVGVDAYLALETGWDTKAYYWNSYIAPGVGVRFKPFESLDFKIGVEYLYRHIYRDRDDDEDVYDAGLGITVEFWNGW